MKVAFIGKYTTELINSLLFKEDVLPKNNKNNFIIEFIEYDLEINELKKSVMYFENKYTNKYIPVRVKKKLIRRKNCQLFVYQHSKYDLDILYQDKIDIIIYNPDRHDSYKCVMNHYHKLNSLFNYVYVNTYDKLSFANISDFILTSNYYISRLINDIDIGDVYNINFLIKNEINKKNLYPLGIINNAIYKYNDKMKNRLSFVGGIIGSASLTSLVAGILLLPIPVVGQILGGTSIAAGITGLGIGGSVIIGGISIGSGVAGSLIGDFASKKLSNLKNINTIEVDDKMYKTMIKFANGNCNDIITVHKYLDDNYFNGYLDCVYIIYQNKLLKIDGKFVENKIQEIYKLEEIISEKNKYNYK
jgi:hypothetical protein